MPLDRGQLALIHIAKRDPGWREDTCRAVPARIAGVTGAGARDTAGFDAVMAFAAYCGFRPMRQHGPSRGHREGMATPGQPALMRQPWSDDSDGRSGAAGLTRRIAAEWHVSPLRFLRKDAAREAITARKARGARASGRRGNRRHDAGAAARTRQRAAGRRPAARHGELP